MLLFVAGSSPSRLATNRTTETADERIAPVPESPKQKVRHYDMIRSEADTLLVNFFCRLPLPPFFSINVVKFVVVS